MPYVASYATMEFVPLRVVLNLRDGAGLVQHDPPNLDNLLARCVVDEATAGALLPDEPVDQYVLPVPLQALWHSPEGFPLYACTPLRPVGADVTDTVMLHKRAQSGHWTASKSKCFKVITIKGRDMERRMPIRTHVCRQWHAEAIGNPQEVARLLSTLVAIGKHRARGFGELDSSDPGWVAPLAEFRLVEDGRLTRRIPAAAGGLLSPLAPVELPSLVGWTPPQWKSALWAPGWREGVAVA